MANEIFSRRLKEEIKRVKGKATIEYGTTRKGFRSN